MATTEKDILDRTALMRTSSEPLWVRLRNLLLEKGMDPQTILLADFFSDDSSFEFGLLVAPDRRCIQFGFDYLHKSVAEGVFSEWEDLTDRYQATPYHQEFTVALNMIGTPP